MQLGNNIFDSNCPKNLTKPGRQIKSQVDMIEWLSNILLRKILPVKPRYYTVIL